MKRSLLTVFVLGLFCFASARAPSQGPVTKDEVRSAMAKVEQSLGKRLGITYPKSALKPGTTPATRVEIVAEFMRVWKASAPKFRFTSRPYPVYPEVLAQNNTGPVIKDLTFLIRRGAVAPVGPLAWGPKPSLEVSEFGDALGTLVHQVTAFTHEPSVKFTPSLMRP